MAGDRHHCSYRVSYADTDRMNRVYYANYLVVAERARTEFLREVGFPYREIEAGGCFFPVRSCQVRYHSYAVYDDLLDCHSHITRLTHATLTFVTAMHRNGEEKPLAVATVELACVNADGKPVAIPQPLKEALTPYLSEDNRAHA